MEQMEQMEQMEGNGNIGGYLFHEAYLPNTSI